MQRPSTWGYALALLGALGLGGPRTLSAQEDPPGPRSAAVLGGVGNSFGWLGAQAEFFFHETRLSGFLGFGYAPPDVADSGDPAFAGGVRGFTRGEKHRGFLELSVSTVLRETGFSLTSEGLSVVDSNRYGPGLQIGYLYTAGWGFTALTSAGVGYAFGVSEEADKNPVAPLLGLGLGFTWR
ncbi:MAG: hypothetical protein RQ751_03755 [Longimicrobiales bacterium]|nr:hypothetical protein [Longimicrobiales bacterium]